jgi:pyridoxamine 5'-phosphate oxidase family protein
MTLTSAEIGYLQAQPLGRLATIQPDGSPQVKPVGFRYNPDLGTIDISGFRMTPSQKFRNVSRDGRAAHVVDDIASDQAVAGPVPGDPRHRRSRPGITTGRGP